MNTYDFELTDFALSNKGIHLLKNRYNFKTIGFHDVDSIILKKGAETKNIVLCLVIGISLLVFAFFQAIGIYESINDPTVNRIYIEGIILPFLPAMIGGYCIYISLKKAPILYVKSGKEKHRLRLKEVIKNNKIEELKLYLRANLQTKFIINDNL
jgi:hypothetical protein